MTVIAAIPTCGKSEYLSQLVSDLVIDSGVDEVLILATNGVQHLDVPHSSKIARVDCPEQNISSWWNRAIRYAQTESSPTALALLNDDIRFPLSNSVSQAAAVLWAHPELVVLGFNYGHIGKGIRYCTGSYRNHGIGGFAFMVDAHRCPAADEQFVWWGSEDSILQDVELQGDKMAIALSLPVEHTAETTAATMSWTHEARAQDRDRFAAKYGRDKTW